MKTRNGFVSNSSTSSFVLMGIKLDNLSEELSDKINKLSKFTYHYVGNGNEYVVGVSICDVGSDGDYLEENSMEIIPLLEEVKSGLTELGIPFSESDIKLFTGTREA